MAVLSSICGNGKSHGMRFLVFEADPIVREQIHEPLAKSGYEVVFATDAEQALQVMQLGDLPTLAVLDWTTQHTDRWQNIRHLKHRRYLYVIALLNWEERERGAEALEAGADDCLYRPTDIEQLQRRIEFGSQIMLERALRDSEERFRIAFEQAAIGMAMIDLGTGGRFIQVNQAFCDFLGYTRQELLAGTIGSVSHPENVPSSPELTAWLTNGEFNGEQIERRYLRKDGGVVWALVSLSLVRDREGRCTHVPPSSRTLRSARRPSKPSNGPKYSPRPSWTTSTSWSWSSIPNASGITPVLLTSKGWDTTRVN